MLETISDNIKGNISSSLINVCHYITEYCEYEFVSTAGNSGLTFSSSMSAFETVSMTNGVGINIHHCAFY